MTPSILEHLAGIEADLAAQLAGVRALMRKWGPPPKAPRSGRDGKAAPLEGGGRSEGPMGGGVKKETDPARPEDTPPSSSPPMPEGPPQPFRGEEEAAGGRGKNPTAPRRAHARKGKNGGEAERRGIAPEAEPGTPGTPPGGEPAAPSPPPAPGKKHREVCLPGLPPVTQAIYYALEDNPLGMTVEEIRDALAGEGSHLERRADQIEDLLRENPLFEDNAAEEWFLAGHVQGREREEA